MSTNTTIEWTDKTWNPVTGCSRVSAGCKNCYAERIAERFRGSKAFPKGFDVTLHPERLQDPYKWRKPARVFVNSMSDLFHESVPFEFVNAVWQTMAAAHWHTFQVLTKRPRRMLDYFEWCKKAMRKRGLERWDEGVYPMANIQLGVSVEDQRTADERIPLLLQVPAAVRFLSCEPLLGQVDLKLDCIDIPPGGQDGFLHDAAAIHPCDYACDGIQIKGGLGWVIAGGESGASARPMHPDWARSLRDQCQVTGTPFFFKQNGAFASVSEVAGAGAHHHFPDGATVRRVGKKAAGRLLDGREWNEFPQALK